jgi:hypothetical protein
VPFLCECADIECLGRVEATLSEFEVIHEDSERFFVVLGISAWRARRSSRTNGRYEIVSKPTAA